MNKPLEKDTQKLLLQWLRLHGVDCCWRQNQGGMKASYNGKERLLRFASMPGISDILAVLPPDGVLLAIEVKREGNKPTVEQQQFLDSVRKSGGVAGVCTSLADLEALLEAAGVRL